MLCAVGRCRVGARLQLPALGRFARSLVQCALYGLLDCVAGHRCTGHAVHLSALCIQHLLSDLIAHLVADAVGLAGNVDLHVRDLIFLHGQGGRDNAVHAGRAAGIGLGVCGLGLAARAGCEHCCRQRQRCKRNCLSHKFPPCFTLCIDTVSISNTDILPKCDIFVNPLPAAFGQKITDAPRP